MPSLRIRRSKIVLLVESFIEPRYFKCDRPASEDDDLRIFHTTYLSHNHCTVSLNKTVNTKSTGDKSAKA